MVFFNYSTMQMAAKVVFYGPGLCGKTTNLQFIYGHTANDSRGEMVSLETETDRTLFFDLLPIDVGKIGGFNTRIQLYTVPGQVFYNTTRKLVLKGVDGVVFVVDSQRAMLDANIESLNNLAVNLAEMGLELDEMPVVLQFNKRDLDDILSVEELNEALNKQNWPYFEASALSGDGVFETLKGVSKLTLLALKRRLAKGTDDKKKAAPVVKTHERTAPKPPPPRPSAPVPAPRPTPAATLEPASAPPARAPAIPAAATGPATPPAAISKPAPRKPKRTKTRRSDVLAELEQLRRQALKSPRGRQAAASNGASVIKRTIELNLSRDEFDQAKRFSFSLQVHGHDDQVLDSVSDLQVDFDAPSSLRKILLRLNIAMSAKE